MESKPGEGKRRWAAGFGRLPGWGKAAVALAAFAVLLFAVAAAMPLFAPAHRGDAGIPGYYAPQPQPAGEPAGLDSVRTASGLGKEALTGRSAAAFPPAAAIAGQQRSAYGSGTPRPQRGIEMQQGLAAELGATSLPSLETWNRQLILTASVALEVADVREAYQQIQIVAAGEGAVITAASLQAGAGAPTEVGSRGGYGRASVVLRMAQSRFFAVRQRLLGLAPELGGRVLRDDVSSQDVTEEYVDLKSRLRNWQSQETQLLQIMSRAQRIPDILAVRNQLAEVQQEIERLTGRLKFLENRVELSTITVEIYQKGKGPVTPTIASTWRNAGKSVAATWSRSLRDVVYLLGMIGVALTYLAPFAFLAAVAAMAIRTFRRRAQAAASPAKTLDS